MSTRGSGRYWKQHDHIGALRPSIVTQRIVAVSSKEAQEKLVASFDAYLEKTYPSASLGSRRTETADPLSEFEPIIEDDMSISNPNAEGVYTNAKAAEYLDLSPTYLHNMRHHKTGPSFTKLNGRIYYRRADLDAWNTERKSKAKARKAKKAERENAKIKTKKAA